MQIECSYAVRLDNGEYACRLNGITAKTKRKLACVNPNSNDCAEAYARRGEGIVHATARKTQKRQKG